LEDGLERGIVVVGVVADDGDGFAVVVGGLADVRRSPGRPPFLSEAQMAELKELVVKGPDPETARVVGWRCLDLRGRWRSGSA
jgi:hypothetical protein